MSRYPARSVICLVLIATGCVASGDDVDGATSSDLASSPTAKSWLGDWLAVLADRPSRSIYPSCAAKGPKLDPTPSSVDAAFSRFCSYFDAVEVYRDCAFASSSVDPAVAMNFGSVRKPGH